jgi:hypothetical protein
MNSRRHRRIRAKTVLHHVWEEAGGAVENKN